MVIKEISGADCREVLSRAFMARLACSREDQPYVVPICIAYETDYLYIFSTFGKKIDWMRTNPKVCLEVDELNSQSDWVSVVVTGRYEELPEPQFTDERDHVRRILEKRHHWWLNALAQRRSQLPDEQISPILARIHIDSVTGLRGQSENE